MNTLNYINYFRRSLFNNLSTKTLQTSEKINVIKPECINTILICRPNQRLGNLLLITPLIQEVESIFPNAKVDIIVKGGLGPILFKNYKNINTIFKLPKKPFVNPLKLYENYYKVVKNPYDLVINATYDSSSGRIITNNSNSKYKLLGNLISDTNNNAIEQKHIAKKPVLVIRESVARTKNKTIPELNLKLSNDERALGRKILGHITKNDKKTICLFTYATGKRIHNKEWWKKMYSEIITNFKCYNVIEILPIENVSQLNFKAKSFYSTNIRELGAVISSTEIFIGADSGIMHLASSVNTPTLGLFKITDENMYRPYNKSSMAINTNSASIKDIIINIKSVLHLD